MPNLRTGGIENVTYRLAEAFGSRGHKVHCITLDPLEHLNTNLSFSHFCIGRNGDSYDAVCEYLKDNAIDIVINQAIEQRWQDLIFAVKPKFPNVKFIKVLHTDPYYLIKGVRDREPLYHESGIFSRILYKLNPKTFVRYKRRSEYSKALYRKWLSLYNHVVLLSHKAIDDFYKIAGIENNGLVSAIGNPVELSKVDIPKEKEKIVLFVGRLHREAKRPDRVVKIWERISGKYPDWELKIIGDGPLKSPLENYCRDNNICNIEFLGQINPCELYQKASILCITSTYEGFSLVCAEALANGVIPIVFNSFGALPDLIKDEVNGLTVSPYDIDEYIAKLSHLMSDENKRERLRINIERDEDFKKRMSIDSIVKQWKKLFKELDIK